MQLQMDRWVEEQVFEEDVRSLLQWLRPNRHERMLGWNEMRTGGAQFRVTVSWDPTADQQNQEGALAVPRMTDVLESILIGSARNADELKAKEEFELYRAVVQELSRRLDEMQACYE